jgi:uncharacterized paraquat-inducible protein A
MVKINKYMEHIKTFEENTDKDKYIKLRFCRICQEMTPHLDGKCLKCKKIRETNKNRKKKYKL